MAMTTVFESAEPTRQDVNAIAGPVLIEFGTPWCGYCKAAQPLLATAFNDRPQIRHLKIEDGKGRPLGRSFAVTLWPTFIFFRDGKEVARLVRPVSGEAFRSAFEQIAV